MSQSIFGTKIKELRLEYKFSLRRFCLAMDIDPSNWSKTERGILPPPRDTDFFEKLATVLELDRLDIKVIELRDVAITESGSIPDYVMSNKELLGLLPMFFRTVGNGRPSTEELEKMVKLIQSTIEK
ncbi:MAG: helix-turn-helix transcriptional regulator [Bacteroidetes bacterium]|nr:helix-turn-helix transcriptional regulator [Bacteroidota bacterium]